MDQPTDDFIKQLAERIKRSDRKAFDELFRVLYTGLFRFARSITRDEAAAYDAIQEAFFNLWLRRKHINPDRLLRSYIYTSVRNQCLNAIRQNNNTIPESDFSNHKSDGIQQQNQHENTQADQLSELFRNWISELPDRQREAFELSRYDGLEHEEIADIMNLSPKTVNNHIVLALQTLKKQYKQYKEHQQHRNG